MAQTWPQRHRHRRHGEVISTPSGMKAEVLLVCSVSHFALVHSPLLWRFHSARDLLHHKKGFSRFSPTSRRPATVALLPRLLCSIRGSGFGAWLFVCPSSAVLSSCFWLALLVLFAFSIWWDEKFHWNWILLWGPLLMDFFFR
uniref:LD11861p n=1 Tax=Drosophila melanogaster TaxID=7227 RepID=Q95RU1_DROME|nr:LD11861p [Drosophila melanogaster]